jgi:hypothetical protein
MVETAMFLADTPTLLFMGSREFAREHENAEPR